MNENRDILWDYAAARLPNILTLLDRNPHSPTYGCLDRVYWHHRTVDFPSGIFQTFVWPIALAWKHKGINNLYYQSDSVREWVRAAILFAGRHAHKDGSCDDYFPHERAGGATAFSLLACLESSRDLNFNDEEMAAFFRRRSDWLASHVESGRLSNHQALIALCLTLAGKQLNTKRWESHIERRLELLLSWQDTEGWFTEYEGCDPGYQTLTISCLAWLHKLKPDPQIQQALEKAVTIVDYFMHPDGSFGGEYTSRNTYNYFPYGLELIGAWKPEALSINDRFLRGLAEGRNACYDDDHIIGHHMWNYLLAWRDFVHDRPTTSLHTTNERIWLPNARLLREQRGQKFLFAALNKGGVFKLFDGTELVVSDTQISMLCRCGSKLRNAVGHLVAEYDVEQTENEIRVAGPMGWAKHKRMTTLNFIGLRAVMFTFGRFFPNLIRSLLQRLLITGRDTAPFRFERTFTWTGQTLTVKDVINAESWDTVVAAGIAPDQTSIYVVMSRTYQPGQLQPWLDLTDKIRQLKPGAPLIVERTY